MTSMMGRFVNSIIPAPTRRICPALIKPNDPGSSLTLPWRGQSELPEQSSRTLRGEEPGTPWQLLCMQSDGSLCEGVSEKGFGSFKLPRAGGNERFQNRLCPGRLTEATSIEARPTDIQFE